MINITGITSERRRRRGFTMVELLIVIGLIALLVGLTATVTLAVRARSEIKGTQNILRILDLAVSEWEASADRKLSWGEEGVPFGTSAYEMLNGTPHVFTATELLRTVARSSSIQTITNQINEKHIHEYDSTDPSTPAWLVLMPNDPDPNAGDAEGQYSNGDWDGTIAVLDAWGNPIRAVHPGRLADWNTFGDIEDPHQTNGPDPDGTVYIDTGNHNGVTFYGVEEIYGVAVQRSVFFVSAGPDGRFGNLSADEDTSLFEETLDNLYSYPVEDPR